MHAPIPFGTPLAATAIAAVAALSAPGFAEASTSPTTGTGSAVAAEDLNLVPRPSNVTASAEQWQPSSTTTIHVPRPADSEEDDDLQDVATVFAHELAERAGLPEPVRTAWGGPDDAVAGDVVLALDDPAEASGAYTIETDGVLTLSGSDRSGVFDATRTVLQVLAQSDAVTVDVSDEPTYERRGLMLDIGRKYYSPAWIEQLIRDMSYLKMNTLRLHISDGLGFRVDSKTHPEVVSDEHLSREDVEQILAVADRYDVEVVPDVDSPGHMDHLLASHPEWRLTLADGKAHEGYLDYSRPEARAFMHDLVTEMADLFDAKRMHIGGDEFFPAPWQGDGPDVVSAESAPQLADYATQELGPDATIRDGFEHYLNGLARSLAARGVTAQVWNDDIRPDDGVTRLDTDIEVDNWIRWDDDRPDAADLADAGYRQINANGDYLYIILTDDGIGEGPTKNPRGIFEEWTPRTFMGEAGNGGDTILPSSSPVLGAHLSVWADSPGSMTQAEVADTVSDWLPPFSQRVWGSDAGTDDYGAFRKATEHIGAAPAGVSAEPHMIGSDRSATSGADQSLRAYPLLLPVGSAAAGFLIAVAAVIALVSRRR